MAIAALVLAFVFFPLGIVLGHLARGQIKRSGEGGRGLATAALILGYLQVAAIVMMVGIAGVLVALGAR
jgi:peptidyl-prolyl cis-trans isomerase B (cyclophilin B)